MLVPGLGPHRVVGELVPVQVELAADETHDGRRHELARNQPAARVAEHAQLQREAQLVAGAPPGPDGSAGPRRSGCSAAAGRAAIFTGGRPVRLPDHRDGWRWKPYAVDGADVEAARQQLQRLMRDAEADIAEALSNEGWLTVLDGPLHGIRHRRGLPVIGYVKTHHRRMLAREHWVRVPELTAGERSGLFAMKDALYGCYLRVGDPGPWAGPWAGIARLEMPSGIGRDAAVEAAERAAAGCRASRRLCTGTRGPR